MIYLCGENRRKKKKNEGCFVFGSDSMFFLCWFMVVLCWFVVMIVWFFFAFNGVFCGFNGGFVVDGEEKKHKTENLSRMIWSIYQNVI